MPLVAGVDTSTQSCKVVVRDAATGALVRSGRAPHPDGTQIDPVLWWTALGEAAADAGGLADVAAIAVGGQQHGMVCLDGAGQVVRPALLWNDTRSAPQALRLVADNIAGPDGGQAWATAVGSSPVASFTITKLAWLAEHEPANAAATAAVCLPHDWLTWRLLGEPTGARLGDLVTDRGDASGTGYYDAAHSTYRRDLLAAAFGRDDLTLPTVLGPSERAGVADGSGLLPAGCLVGPGTGDNAAAALGVGAATGDVVASIGTSGTVFGVSSVPAADGSGTVAGFADATGNFLPLVCTLNAARVLSAAAAMLGVDLDTLAHLALSAPAGAGGAVLLPYLEGERTPNLPGASGSLHGLRLDTMTPSMIARAAVEGLLCGLADGLDALRAQGLAVHRVLLVGGGARSAAVQQLAPAVFGVPVSVPAPGEYVADGAARQAAWVLSGADAPPNWPLAGVAEFTAEPTPVVRAQYAAVRRQMTGL